MLFGFILFLTFITSVLSYIIITFTKNYNVLLGCRKIQQIVMPLGVIIFSMYLAYSPNAQVPFLRLLYLGILFYYLLSKFFSPIYYDSSHIKYLDYFILYLRSFKDDKRNHKNEYRLMKSLYDGTFAPFAVGRPNEIIQPTGALRIYIGDNWKEHVSDMINKAPIVILRVSDTEHFLWEFKECISLNAYNKMILWIDDIKEYEFFFQQVITDFLLPQPNSIVENCLVYFNDQCQCRTYQLKDKKSYSYFINQYIEDNSKLTSDYSNYLYGRRNILSIFWSWKYKDQFLDGIQRWDWIAFFFAEFYVIFHRIKNRAWLYVGMLLFSVLSYKAAIICSSINPLLAILAFAPRILISFLWAKNGSTIVWLSEKWESTDYFVKIYNKNNKKVLIYTFIFVIWYIWYR